MTEKEQPDDIMGFGTKIELVNKPNERYLIVGWSKELGQFHVVQLETTKDGEKFAGFPGTTPISQIKGPIGKMDIEAVIKASNKGSFTFPEADLRRAAEEKAN